MARAQRIKSGAIEVHGLAKLNRALREMDADAPKALRETNKKMAEKVKTGAVGRAYGLGGVAGHVAPSLRATAGVKSAGVAGGGASYPMFGGAEFGSIRYKQFQPWRGSGSDAGYFLYPTIRDMASSITTEYEAALDDLIRKAGLG